MYSIQNLNKEDKILAASISGQINDILFINNSNWMPIIKKEYNLINIKNIEELIDIFDIYIEGYVLMNKDNPHETLNIVSSNKDDTILFNIIAHECHINLLEKHGINEVNLKICEENFNNKIICFNDPEKNENIVDWAIYNNSETIWGLDKLHKIPKESKVYGWAPSLNLSNFILPLEGPFVRYLSQKNSSIFASDLVDSLVAFSKLEIKDNKLSPKKYKEIEKDGDDNKINISFLISDGDNLCFILHRMLKLVTTKKSFPLGWTINPDAVNTMPFAMKTIYEQASEFDSFVAGPSGFGYCYPNCMENTDRFRKETSEIMKQSGLDIVNQIDFSFNGLVTIIGDYFGLRKYGPNIFNNSDNLYNKEVVKGIIKYDYFNYSVGNGNVYKNGNQTTLTGSSINLFIKGPTEQNKQDFVKQILSRPKGSHSLIPVTVWSWPIEELEDIVSRLGDKVRIITPNQMIDES